LPEVGILKYMEKEKEKKEEEKEEKNKEIKESMLSPVTKVKTQLDKEMQEWEVDSTTSGD